jgi:putative membrane protein
MRRRALMTALPLAAFAAGRLAPANAQGILGLIPGTGVGANEFVQLATISDNFEIQSSQIVLARSQHPQIREFAQRMVEQHTAMSKELQGMPEASTRQPAALDDRHSNMLTLLRQQEDVDLLNRYYVQQQVEAHEEALAGFEAYASGGEVPALKAFAQRYAPTIREHLQMARALQAPQAG